MPAAARGSGTISASPMRSPRAGAVRGGDDERRRGAVAEARVMRGEPAVGIDHHPHRLLARAAPHGELRIVMQHRARADDDRVGRARACDGCGEVLLAAEPARGAAGAGDAAVEALRQMRHDERSSAAVEERAIEREERRGPARRRRAPRRARPRRRRAATPAARARPSPRPRRSRSRCLRPLSFMLSPPPAPPDISGDRQS